MFDWIRGRRGRGVRSPGGLRFRPTLEGLGDRVVPSVTNPTDLGDVGNAPTVTTSPNQPAFAWVGVFPDGGAAAWVAVEGDGTAWAMTGGTDTQYYRLTNYNANVEGAVEFAFTAAQTEAAPAPQEGQPPEVAPPPREVQPNPLVPSVLPGGGNVPQMPPPNPLPAPNLPIPNPLPPPTWQPEPGPAWLVPVFPLGTLPQGWKFYSKPGETPVVIGPENGTWRLILGPGDKFRLETVPAQPQGPALPPANPPAMPPPNPLVPPVGPNNPVVPSVLPPGTPPPPTGVIPPVTPNPSNPAPPVIPPAKDYPDEEPMDP